MESSRREIFCWVLLNFASNRLMSFLSLSASCFSLIDTLFICELSDPICRLYQSISLRYLKEKWQSFDSVARNSARNCFPHNITFQVVFPAGDFVKWRHDEILITFLLILTLVPMNCHLNELILNNISHQSDVTSWNDKKVYRKIFSSAITCNRPFT